jgi:hypothetical protein
VDLAGSNGYQAAKSRHLFMDLIDATADIMITEREVLVKLQKRALVDSPGGRHERRASWESSPTT